jgi:hypothetical protein
MPPTADGAGIMPASLFVIEPEQKFNRVGSGHAVVSPLSCISYAEGHASHLIITISPLTFSGPITSPYPPLQQLLPHFPQITTRPHIGQSSQKWPECFHAFVIA